MASFDGNILHDSGREAKRKACDNCKRRKVRCDGNAPCHNCIRYSVDCTYSQAHGRLAQTNRRLARALERVQLLESAWRQFLPDVDIPTAIATAQNVTSAGDAVSTTSDLDRPQTSDGRSFEPTDERPKSPTDSNAGEEGEDEDVTALDWDESMDLMVVADGFASLTVNTRGIGYMGPQSGNALLKKLQSISALYFPVEDNLMNQQSPVPDVPTDVLRSPAFFAQCIDSYFQHYHSAYPIINPAVFRAQMSGALAKPKDGSWPILVNTVLAIGAFSGNLMGQNAEIWFCQEASRHLSWDILRRGTLSLVQSFALLANYLQKRNRPNSAFTLLGIAMNMAQGIGLHRELSRTSANCFTMELRRRVWWTLFIFDSGARLTFGRPTLNLGGINIRLPRNIDDDDLAVDLEALPDERKRPTNTSSLIWQARLARISNSVNERLVDKHYPEQKKVVVVGEEIDQWTNSLPEYMRSEYDGPGAVEYAVPRMVLLWRAMHLRIVVYRPFLLVHIYQRHSLDFDNRDQASTKCFSAADECVSSIVHFWTTASYHSGALAWYACYWLVTAVFVHVTCLLHDPQNSLASGWRHSIENTKAVLFDMGPYQPIALRAAHIIQKILNLVPTKPDSNFFEINEPIRMEVAQLWNQNWADMAVPQESPPSDWLMNSIPDS